MRNLLLFTASVLVALLLAEGILRLVPLEGQRIRGDRIILRTNTHLDIPNFRNPKLPERLQHTRNNIGFRGPDWEPSELNGAMNDSISAALQGSDREPAEHPDRKSLRIFAVGGSTTECFYLSDGFDWPAVMARELQTLMEQGTTPAGRLWINNAGLDGHSTFGHLILLEDILVRYQPDIILYLVGANDVGRLDLSDHNNAGISSRRSRSRGGNTGTDNASSGTAAPSRNSFDKDYLRPSRILSSAAHYSEIATLADNLLRGWRARKLGVTHQNIDFANHPTAQHTETELQQTLEINQYYYLPGYRNRLETLVTRTLSHGIIPVLLTQPVPYGPATDLATGVDLSAIEVRGSTGYLRWREIEMYNDITRQVAQRHGLLLIDLEQELPKNSDFYYDFIHFTQDGAQQVGQITAKTLLPAITNGMD